MLHRAAGFTGPNRAIVGLVIVPLDEERLDAIAMSVEPAIDGFTYLTPRMAHEIAITVRAPALYLETEFFGGIGGQSAAYFENGGIMWWGAESTENAPVGSTLADLYERTANSGKSPISDGLARLGVSASDERDEFDQIGLHRFRSVEALGIKYDD